MLQPSLGVSSLDLGRPPGRPLFVCVVGRRRISPEFAEEVAEWLSGADFTLFFAGSLSHGSGGWRVGVAGIGSQPLRDPGSPMPFKANADRRHHIPKQRRRITNWAAYVAALRQRGSLTVWFTQEAIAAWEGEPRTTPGGPPHYSSLAITTALTLKAVFRLALRQTEGLIGSIIGLLGLSLRVPDHTTLSRRAATVDVPRPQRPSTDAGGDTEPVHLLVDSTGLKLCGPGEWLIEKHGTRKRRSWRKLVWGIWCQALNVDAVSFLISHPRS